MKLLTQRGIKMKKTIIYYLVTAAMLLSLSSCGEKADDSSSEAEKTETKASVTSEAETASEAEPEYKGEFNDKVFEELCQNIVIRGQKVSFPFTLNDLGDEYTFDDDPLVVESKHMAYYDLYKNNERLCSAVTRTEDVDQREYKIISLWVTEPQYDIIFDDISIGDNIEKAFQKYGEKKEAYKDDYYTRYDYKITDDKYIYYLVTDDNLIAEISIWWR